MKTNNKKKGLKVYRINGSQKKEIARIVKARRQKTLHSFLVVVIVILAIVAVFSAVQTFLPGLFGRISLGGELAAKVNGMPITLQQLNQEYDRLPLEYQYVLTKETFLGQLIDEIILEQEAIRQGITITEQEVDENLESFMQGNNLSEEDLNEILKQKKLTLAELRDLVMNQFLIEKLLEDVVKDKVSVATEQVLQYYNDNPDTFKIPELATVRHILIGLVNWTEQEAEERVNMVFELVENDMARFCSYVWLYTDDSGSAETCGEYTFPRGQMVEEFENTAFTQNAGEASIVKTDFGYHIVWTINKTPEKLIPFKDVQEQITLILENQQEKMLYSDFIVSLREKSDIVNYLEGVEEEAEETEEEIVEEAEAGPEEPEAEGEVQIIVEMPEEPEEEEVPEEEVEEVEEVEELEVEEELAVAEEQEELEQEVEEVIEEVVEEPEEAEPEPEMNFAECLASEEAVLYGAFWDSSTKKQRAYFGADISKINYVECGVKGDYRAQQVVCVEVNILAYPTWVIGDEKHMGIMTPRQLSALTGCEI